MSEPRRTPLAIFLQVLAVLILWAGVQTCFVALGPPPPQPTRTYEFCKHPIFHPNGDTDCLEYSYVTVEE